MKSKGRKTTVKTAMLVGKNVKPQGCKGLIYRGSRGLFKERGPSGTQAW